MRDRDFWPRAMGVFLVFVGAGPLIGGFVFGLTWILQVLTVGPEPWRMEYIATPIYAALLGYLVGLVPAAVTAVGAIGLSLVTPRWPLWAAVVTGFGCLVGVAGFLISGDDYPASLPGGWDLPRMMIVASAAALGCARLSASFRPILKSRRKDA